MSERELVIRDLLPGAEQTVKVGAEELSLLARTQVVVAGGGPAGVMAAVAAGRRGAEVILVEPQPFLGGVATGGVIHFYYWGLSGGLQDELDRRDRDLDARISAATRGFHPEARKVEMERMVLEAGVAAWLRCCVVGAVLADGTVRGVVVDGERGRGVILCEVVVDATGDADVAALAGARFEMGRPGDGLLMAYSLTPGVSAKQWHVWHANFDAGWVDPTDPWDYARGFLDGRHYLWRERYQEAERLHFCAPVLGVRESRKIVGDYVLTLEDLFLGRCFADTIGRTRSHYDNHARDYATESWQARVFVDVTGNFQTALECDVPYRCLLPRGIEGLLVAGRSISMTHDAEQAVRMQKDMQRIGEAAGIAAALAVRDGVAPRAVDVAEVQRELIHSGILTRAQVEAGARGELLRPLRPVAELVAELSAAGRDVAMFQLYLHAEGAVSALREAMHSSDTEVARWAALVLGAHGRDEARPLLVAMVAERDPALAGAGPFVLPRWIGALACLVRMPGPDLTDLLTGLLGEETDWGAHRLYAFEGLERSSDARAAAAVHDFLRRLRDDERFWGDRLDPRRHAGWKFEIAAARALRAMGDPEGEAILRRYAQDERLPVRRYARLVLG
ncbi:MAG: FAD-dependent oxidoreductase [Armatimonadota bacterium]